MKKELLEKTGYVLPVYLPPMIEVENVKVEQGFAISGTGNDAGWGSWD
jgi:hypothetical protein